MSCACRRREPAGRGDTRRCIALHAAAKKGPSGSRSDTAARSRLFLQVAGQALFRCHFDNLQREPLRAAMQMRRVLVGPFPKKARMRSNEASGFQLIEVRVGTQSFAPTPKCEGRWSPLKKVSFGKGSGVGWGKRLSPRQIWLLTGRRKHLTLGHLDHTSPMSIGRNCRTRAAQGRRFRHFAS